MASRLPNTEKVLVCSDCGTEFTANRRDVKRCPACKLAVALAHDRRERPERVRPGNREKRCEGCGKSFPINRSDTKWCPACRVKRTMEHDSRLRPDKHVAQTIQKACTDCRRIFLTSGKAVRCEDCRKERIRLTAIRSRARADKGICPKCGKPKDRRSKLCKECGRYNLPAPRSGEAHPNWKGGKTLSGGYVLIKVNGRYEREHRMVIEQAYGPIPAGHQVHHLNGIKTDNRLENLAAMSNSDHHRDHHGPWEQRIRELEAQLAAGATPKTRPPDR